MSTSSISIYCAIHTVPRSPLRCPGSSWTYRWTPRSPQTRRGRVRPPARWRFLRCSPRPERWPLYCPPRDIRFLATTSPSSCGASPLPVTAGWRWSPCHDTGNLTETISEVNSTKMTMLQVYFQGFDISNYVQNGSTFMSHKKTAGKVVYKKNLFLNSGID